MKVALIGPICKDINVIRGVQYSQPGGTVYYAGQALASLGADTTVLASYRSGMPTEGFKFKLVRIPSKSTIEFRNVYPEEGNPDSRVQYAKAADNEILPDQIPTDQLSGLDHIILGPLFHNNISKPLIHKLHVFSSAEISLAPQGIIRYLDGEKVVWKNPERVLDLLPLTSRVFLDEDELKFIGGTADLEEAVRVLQHNGAKAVIVTQSSRGSWIFSGRRKHRIPAFPPRRLADPTGAGDSYMAGFIRAQERYSDLAAQGKFAAMTATMSMEQLGPFSGTAEDVRERVKESGL